MAFIKMRMYIVLTYISLHIVFTEDFMITFKLLRFLLSQSRSRKREKKTEYYEIEYLTHKSQYEPAEQMRTLAQMLGCTGSPKSNWVIENSQTGRNI